MSILSALILCAACTPQENPEQSVAAAPQLVSSSPEQNATGIAAGSLKVVLSFDVSVKCPTEEREKISISPEADIESIVAVSKDVTVSLSGLQTATTYTLKLPSGTVSGFSDNPAGDISLTFTTVNPLEPDPGPEPDPDPVEDDYPIGAAPALSNPAAASPAVDLYNYIKAVYGTSTLSGAMGGVAWSTEFDDYIYEFSGEYPAIVGFDYIHLAWSPANWIDYGDITPVRDAWKAGNIIQIGWHWCAPNTEADYKKGQGYPGNGYNFSGYGFYAPGKGESTTSFDLGQALTEGTWQKDFLDSDIRKLATYLQLLEDEGIPVLFRPLHEAAGDYKWGAWFWWGRYGAEKCKALWQYLYKELTETYGLDNLIWVWTAQTSKEGKLAKVSDLQEWYPGDEYVDIVGADLYVDGGTSQSSAFRLVNNSVKGGKIVALSECGSLLSPDLYFEEDAPWAYFMGWGDTVPLSSSTNGWNSENDWKKALQNHYVLNRDDLPDFALGYAAPSDLGWESGFAATAGMKTGWNLGNTLDSNSNSDGWIVKYTAGQPSDWETAWGQPVTSPELITMFKDAGFGAIRVPVTWNEHMDENGTVDKAWMDRVEQIVNYVLDEGLYCILNVHHDTGTDGWMRASRKGYYATAERYKGLWRQIAERFAPYGQKLLFESYNELLDDSDSWNSTTTDGFRYANYYNEDFVNVVRSTGGSNNFNRNLICNTYAASATKEALKAFVLPSDRIEGHLIAEVHSYAPYNFAMNEGTWAVQEFDSSCESEVVGMIEDLNEYFISKGIPCIIGEYGCTAARANEESCKQAACYVSTAAKYGIPCFYWMTLVDGEDRTNLVWTRPDLKDTIINSIK